jgi:hypothetical protein
VHAPNPPPSRAQLRLAPTSVLNVKLPVLEVVSAVGCVAIVAVGAVVSSVKLRAAVQLDWFPAPSVERACQ